MKNNAVARQSTPKKWEVINRENERVNVVARSCTAKSLYSLRKCGNYHKIIGFCQELGVKLGNYR